MYVIDIRHFLNHKGEIGPQGGKARKLAEFIAEVIAHESDFDRPERPGPTCFKCRKGQVESLINDIDTILWRCPRCTAEGSITGWQDTFWDVSNGIPKH